MMTSEMDPGGIAFGALRRSVAETTVLTQKGDGQRGEDLVGQGTRCRRGCPRSVEREGLVPVCGLPWHLPGET